MKLYTITYSSSIDCELYAETFVATTREQAQERFKEYVREIAEDCDENETKEILDYINKDFMDYGDIVNGYQYYITIQEQEIQ